MGHLLLAVVPFWSIGLLAFGRLGANHDLGFLGECLIFFFFCVCVAINREAENSAISWFVLLVFAFVNFQYH